MRTISGNIPQCPFERRNQKSILGVMTGDGPADEESQANNEPKYLHTKSGVRES